MKKLTLIITFGFAIIFLLIGCNNDSELEKNPRRFIVKYKNGSIYCEGFLSILKKSGLPKYRTGTWKFYYPSGKLEKLQEFNKKERGIGIWKRFYMNGTLETFTEYDENGEYVNYKRYNENGVLVYSSVNIDKTEYINQYYGNGKISMEQIITKEVSGEDDQYETTTTTQKLYYQNGQLYRQDFFEDENPYKTTTIWDTTGDLVLSYENKDLLIIPNKPN